MIITAIIAEYNPFHNGHAYQLDMARQLTNADCMIVIMGGNFMQRGEPALMDKYLRAGMALSGNADLVIELPVCYAVSGAEYFARGAVSLLNSLGIVDYLCFGSECGSIELLTEAAAFLAKEPPLYQNTLRQELKNGHSYPAARQIALKHCLSDPSILETPNNILGIEYIKALLLTNSTIHPVTLKRNGADYHALTLSASDVTKTPSFPSARALRQTLLTPDADFTLLSHHIPSAILPLLSANRLVNYPVEANDFSTALFHKLLETFSQKKQKTYTSYLDITDDFSDKICKNLFRFENTLSFCRLLKSKDLTYTRISRNLFHILLNITSRDMEEYTADGTVFYARILGLNSEKTKLTNTLKKNSSLPLISNPSKADSLLSETGRKQFASDLFACNLYNYIVSVKFHRPMENELLQKPVTLH